MRVQFKIENSCGTYLDYVCPEQHKFDAKVLNEEYGAYHAYMVDEVKDKFQLLFDRYRCFGNLLHSESVSWNKFTNELTIENHNKCTEVSRVSFAQFCHIIVTYLYYYSNTALACDVPFMIHTKWFVYF